MTYDPALSYRGNGLLGRLAATYRPGDVVDVPALFRPEHREGRDAVRATLRELAAAGYIVVERTQDAGGRWSTRTILTPKAAEASAQVTPGTANPSSVAEPDASAQVTPETGSPFPVTPETGSPFPAEEVFPQVTPETDSPAPVKPFPTSTYVGTRTSPRAVVADARARRRTRTTTTATELAASAVSLDAARLVAAWRSRDPGRAEIPDWIVRALQRQVDDLLRNPTVIPELIPAALDEWETRPDAKPGLLRHLYADQVQARRAQQVASRSSTTNARPSPRRGMGAKAADWLELAERLAVQRRSPSTSHPVGLAVDGRPVIEGELTA